MIALTFTWHLHQLQTAFFIRVWFGFRVLGLRFSPVIRDGIIDATVSFPVLL